MFHLAISILSHFAHLGRIQTWAHSTDYHKNFIKCLYKKPKVKANSKPPNLF